MQVPIYPQEFHREYDGLVQSFLPDGSILLVDHGSTKAQPLEEAHHWLLLPTGEAVAFCRSLYYSSRSTHRLILCEVEVRPAYRGAGLSREIIEAAEAYYGERMWATGAFTEAGLRSLAFVPLVPNSGPRRARFHEMDFVKDWHNLIEKYPLSEK